MWYVIGLIWLAMIAGVIWSYKKKQQKRDAEHARKFGAFLVGCRPATRALPKCACTVPASGWCESIPPRRPVTTRCGDSYTAPPIRRARKIPA